MRIRTIFVLFALFCIIENYGQSISLENIPTPNASNLGRYGDIPVSGYTGQPNISIPLHSFEIGGCKMSISLQYDASGVQVNQLPGWTGGNWTLHAGGAIVRTRCGTCDEAVSTRHTAYSSFTNYFSSPSQLSQDINDDERLKDNVYFNRYDYSPDIFTFNFMGKSGKFFLGNDGQWKVRCDENIDIVFNVADESNYIHPFIGSYPNSLGTKVQKTIKGFTLIDDNGYVYVFGGNINAIEYTLPFFRQMETERTECFFPYCWYLTSVKDKYGNELYHFDYERGKFIAQFYRDEEWIKVEDYNKMNGIPYGNAFYRDNSFFPYGGVLNSPVYLKRISYNNNPLVTFISEYSDTPTESYYPNLKVSQYYHGASYEGLPFYFLQTDEDSIKKYQYIQTGVSRYEKPLSSTRLKLLKHIDFQYGSSIDFSYGQETRHFLREITFNKGKDEEKKYVMKYYYPENLPSDNLSKSTDDWGYYSFKSTTADESNPFAIDLYASRFGTLTEIKYPTGGKTSFEYDINDFSLSMSDDRSKTETLSGLTGGLRIRKISDYDTDEKSLLRCRTFSYENPYTRKSSGELFAKPLHSWENWYANTDDKGAYSKQSYGRNISIIPLSNSFGPHVGYSYVKETELDNTYKVYRFKNISSAYDERFLKDFSDGKPSPFDMFTERGYKRGKIMSIEQYSNNGDLLYRKAFGYPKENLETEYVLTSNLRHGNFSNMASFSFYTGGIYKLLFPKYDVIEDTVFQYNEKGIVTDIRLYKKEDKIIDVYYGYPHKAKVRTLSEDIQKRGSFEQCTKYYFSHNSTEPILQEMAKNMFCIIPYSTKTFINGTLRGGTIRKYLNTSFGPVVYSESNINQDGTISEKTRYGDHWKTGLPKKIIKEGLADKEVSWSYFNMQPSSSIIKGGNNPENETITKYWDYDEFGNVTDITFPNGYIRGFEYDSNGRLTHETENIDFPVKIIKYNFGK